ncbi:uncharacterized protein Z520_11774 [Fonsecaea multimorphosa CBS 102226]|uniref:Uncharacterized protein n=1 Tax=Fonsecaea multimorphosa CBS 102226 TaxID=1442371 RepID=A0A0D2JPR9_9EURO|nr:uncharacterized protein Z520_11774 [Fonsecaea multimorphosa CBS 102226]KIX92454.1 hypothetical protein Z520_11774 [Fonsecaea multimorphosa CBS 102226]
MADFSTPHNARTPSHQQPKQMSSRLLNMKFMQRAAAATTPRSATSTPTSSTTHQTPATEPLAKRRRIDSTTSSPSATSTPGTPSNGLAYAGSSTPTNASQNSGLGIAPRGGTSTFTRFEGADTEWVLDLKMRFSGDKQPSYTDANGNDERVDPARSRFGLLSSRNEDEEEEEEEDIWNNNQPSGRQTFGSFDGKRRKSRSSTRQGQGQDHDENDPDLSSASDSDSAPDSDSDSDSDLERDNIPNSSNRSTPRQTNRGTPAKPTTATAEIDSDEEMDRVRMAIEQKHRSMMGSGGHGARNTLGTPKAGNKRKREGNGKKNKNKNKKARKTM